MLCRSCFILALQERVILEDDGAAELGALAIGAQENGRQWLRGELEASGAGRLQWLAGVAGVVSGGKKRRSPICCSCTANIMSRLATDCFVAVRRLQYTSFRTNSVDLNDALLVSIHDCMDAGSRELYIYDQVHMNGPPEMGRHFWGHLPLSWMHGLMLGFTLYHILFSNEEARDDDNRLWVLVLRDTRWQRPHRWT